MIDREVLGTIATEAAAAMFSLQLEAVDAAGDAQFSRSGRHSVMLRLHGAPAIFVGLACDDVAGIAIASTIFEVDPQQVNEAMIDDALRELANIFAGQVKSMLAPEHQIGLPRIQSDPKTFADREWHGVSLRIGESDQVLDLAVAA
jgi:hypothetical protein